MKRHVAALTAGTLLATAGAAALGATPSPSIGGGVLATGVLKGHSSITVRLSHSNGFVMENATVPAGTTFGWHYHRTAVIVAVSAGTLTLYDPSSPHCIAHRYRAGQGFIEPANHIHLARNEGKIGVTLDATYISVPASLRANPNDLDVSNQPFPHNCPPSVH